MRQGLWNAILGGILLGVLPSLSAAQAPGTLFGHVTDGDGAALPGANVRVEGTGQGVATDEDGRYLLDEVDPGTHVIVVSAVGFAEMREQVTLEAGEERRVDVELEETVVLGEEVVVTGTMRETHVKESPVKVNVVPTDRLRQGKTSANLMDLIGSVGGLSTQLNCGVCGTNAIRINGVEGPNTAVLIDGMPVMGALASVYGLNGISPSIIDRVEVIKGPQSTLYGTQALGGVVNVMTKRPKNTPFVSANVYGQSTREGSVQMAVAPTAERIEGFVSGNLLRMEHFFDENGDGFGDVPKRSRAALFGKGTLYGNFDERRLTVAGKVYAENRTGGTAEFTDDLRGSEEVYGESIYTRRSELLAEYHPAGLEERLRVSGAFTYHDQDSYYGTEHYVARQTVAFGQVTWDQSFGRTLDLLAGTTFRYETYDDNTPATSRGADRRFIPGIFAQNEVLLGDVTLLTGMRLDHHDEHGFVPAPRLSMKYQPSDRTTIRASAGTGFRLVNVFTEDHAALTGSRDVVFAEELAPERSRSGTVSAEHIVPFGTNPLTVSVDGFYTHFSNKIVPDYDQDPDLIVYENLSGHSVTRGLSVGLDQNFTILPVTYNASVTLMDVFTEEGGQRRAVTYAPDFTGSFGTTYEWRDGGVEVEYGSSLVGPKRMPDSYVASFGRTQWSPSYTTHDLKVTKTFTRVTGPSGLGVEASLSVENLFDYTQGSPLVAADRPFSEQFDTIYTWGPIVGRTFSLGIRVTVR